MIVMVRYWFFAAFVVIIALRNGGIAKVRRSAKPVMQWLRGILLPLEICVTVAAFTILGLTESHAIFVCYPLIIVALSGPMLGEQIGWRRWGAVLVGFIGVMVLIQPGSGVFFIWVGLPLLGAFVVAS